MLRADRSDGTVEEVTQNGLFFGFSRATPYGELEQPLRQRDRFLLYTDGLVEAMDAREELYGAERVAAALAATTAQTPDETIDRLIAGVDAWGEGAPNDDLTLVVIDLNPTSL